MSSKRENVFHASGGRFIQPGTVGSGINWKIDVDAVEAVYTDRSGVVKSNNHVNSDGSIGLSDCGRWIQWDVDPCDPVSVEKLDAAIEELMACRRAVAKAAKIIVAKRKALGVKDDD